MFAQITNDTVASLSDTPDDLHTESVQVHIKVGATRAPYGWDNPYEPPAPPVYEPPAPPTAGEIRAQIASLEQAQLLPRATREFMLLSMQSMFTSEQLALNPGYSAVKAFDDSITALRVQL